MYVPFNQNSFKPLEVVDRGSETQLQVTENLNLIAPCSSGQPCKMNGTYEKLAARDYWRSGKIREVLI